MNARQIKEAIVVLDTTKQPAFLWGAPGIGKSQVVSQVAEEQKLQLIDIRAILLDPVDLRGLPHINGDNRAHWCQPDFLPRKGKGILFLDELNAAPQLVQAACYQLVLDRKLGEYTLPPGWTVIAAGNRETDRAVTNRMPSALANRFVHINFDVDLEDWVAWALETGIQTELISFLRFRPELLHSFDPKKNDKAFPSPRSWEFVSRILASRPAQEIEYELLTGTVGEGAAAELMAFLRIFRSLPNPDVVLMNPDTANVPEDPATLYAICGALSHKAGENTIGRLCTYANRLPAEFSVLLIRDSVKHAPGVVNSRAFVEWASAHSEVLI